MDSSKRLTLVSTLMLAASFWWSSWAMAQAQDNNNNKHQAITSDHPNFHNQSGCLYAYIGDSNHYLITFPDAEPEKGTLDKLVYDSNKSNCTKDIFPGNLVFSFGTNVNDMDGMTLELQIKPYPSEGYWEISKAILKLDNPRNKQLIPIDTFEMKTSDMYAGEKFSYSCNKLVLQNLVSSKDGPRIKITLRQFQIQPFQELDKYVFAASFDCSVWITMPVLMGLILVLFIIFTVMIGVYLLMEQGNQQGDLKFSKQAGMLMNQAQLDATKG